MYSRGSSKVWVPCTQSAATDSGTGISFRRVNSLPAVLMTSSSCEPQGAMIGESSEDEACCEVPAVCVYGPTSIASKVQNPGVARALPSGMSLTNELWVPPQGFWGKVKGWDGQHGGRVANAAVWQRSQSTGFRGETGEEPPLPDRARMWPSAPHLGPQPYPPPKPALSRTSQAAASDGHRWVVDAFQRRPRRHGCGRPRPPRRVRREGAAMRPLDLWPRS